MEQIFAIIITLMVAASALYLLVGFVIIPIVKIYKETIRIKRNARLK
ncbi:MAG: hypothetical protein GX092_01880 [Clostridia bacterium]|jgi:hypothetical protein|nr:hypothetical protein [Clostridia bacterium]